MREIRLSPSAMQTHKACPMRYLYSYVYGLTIDQDKDALRMGTNWQRCHEILGMTPGEQCPDCLRREEIIEECSLCGGTGYLPDDVMDAVVRTINDAYETVPESKTAEQWETERVILLYSISGYRWHYGQDSLFDVIASEVYYNLPLIGPGNRAMTKARVTGKIDHLVRMKDSGLIYVLERKSTSKSVNNESYWSRLILDDQITSYLYAARLLQLMGKLEEYGIAKDDPQIHGIYYDVWSKPGIKPKKITKADVAKLEKEGTYCGEQFDVPDNGFETPEMYGARLLTDIAERPEFYFEQREIPRTGDQLANYEQTLSKMVQLIRYVETKDLWYRNDLACESPFRCEFRSLCYNNVDVKPDEIPEGFCSRWEKR